MADVRIDCFRILGGDGNPLPGAFPRRRLAKAANHAGRAGAGVHAGSFEVLTADSPKSNDDATFLRLYAIRSDRWPHFAQHGDIHTLDELIDVDDNDEMTGIAEVTHYGFFPGNLLFAVYNHFGPKTAKLARWLDARYGIDVEFEAVPRVDVLEAVGQASEVKKFTVRFPARTAEGIASSGTFGRDARRLARLGATTVEITLTAKGEHDRESLKSSVTGVIAELFSGAAKDSLEAARVEIGDDDDFGRSIVNLLGENLILDLADALPEGNSRYLSPSVARSLLSHAATTLKGEITKVYGELPEDPDKRSDEPLLPRGDPDT